MTHRHASHGDCLTVCGIPCGDVDTAYAHDAERVTCETCKGPDTSRARYLASLGVTS